MTAADLIAAFLLAAIADDEQVARSATPSPWVDEVGSVGAPKHRAYGTTVAGAAMVVEGEADAMECGDSAHIARWDPKRALAECDAKRKLIGLLDEVADLDALVDNHLGGRTSRSELVDDLLKTMALPYASRDGYQAEWAP